MSQYVIGIDVGGTNVKLGVVNVKGKVIARSSFATGAHVSQPAVLIDALVQAVQALMRDRGIERGTVTGVGIGLPGLVDADKGVVRILPNIPGWLDVPLRKIMQRKLRMAVVLENDVNMITLGEWKFGAGRGVRDLVCITLGTGVGGGLILNNSIYRGPGFAAGELGHAPLNEEGPACGCGGWGCFEQYVGNRFLQKNAAAVLGRKDISLEDVYGLAVEGHKKALGFWAAVGGRVGTGLVGIINILNPSMIVIGGGVAGSFDFICPAIEETIKRRCMKIQAGMVKVVRARLGTDAGLVGAKVLVCHDK